MKKLNNKGFTLIEIIVSIAVASIILTMLMQMLVMSISARNLTYVDNLLETEAYLLAEDIKRNAFEHETQYVRINETASEITVTFIHKWDITIDPTSHAIDWVEVDAGLQNMELVFDKNANTFSLDGTTLHSPNIYFEYDVDQYTTMSVSSVDETCDPSNVTHECEDVVLTLTLFISSYQNGVLVDIQKFETTIII